MFKPFYVYSFTDNDALDGDISLIIYKDYYNNNMI